jgi:hypothetical protein
MTTIAIAAIATKARTETSGVGADEAEGHFG